MRSFRLRNNVIHEITRFNDIHEIVSFQKSQNAKSVWQSQQAIILSHLAFHTFPNYGSSLACVGCSLAFLVRGKLLGFGRESILGFEEI